MPGRPATTIGTVAARGKRAATTGTVAARGKRATAVLGEAPAAAPAVSFEVAVDHVLSAIPAGEVLTYGEVAEEAGFPGRARAVGRLLASSGGRYPWWRVVAANGRLVPGHEAEHARRLRAEGTAVVNNRVRMARRSSTRARAADTPPAAALPNR